MKSSTRREINRMERSHAIINTWGRLLQAASKLTGYPSDEVAAALAFIRMANPELVSWLSQALQPPPPAPQEEP